MNNKSSDMQIEKLGEFLECMVPNVIGLYLNSYLGVALSVVLLLWHWQQKINPDRPQRPLLISLGVVILLTLPYPSGGSSTKAIAPPPVFNQPSNGYCPLKMMKNQISATKQ